MKKLLIALIWFPTTIFTLIISLYFFSYKNIPVFADQKPNILTNQNNSFQMYVSLPKILGVSSAIIKSEDAIPELITQYLTKYHSPMAESSEQFVNTFRTYGIDPIIPLAIAQCETNLGEKIPKEGCKNPFGLGVHSQGTLCFDNWNDAYIRMAQILKKDYIDQGYTSPEIIMRKYCPLSLDKGGSWAKCVTQFIEEIETLKIRHN